MIIEYRCSCGDSFDSADDLIQHANSAHGVNVE